MMRPRARLSIFTRFTTLLLVAVGSAHAHIPLTPEILDDAFEELEQARAKADGETETAGKAAAIYAFAIKATELMTLLNQEIQLHGVGQQDLLDETVSRAAGLGVEITWSQDHERYFYTGNAYRQYLQLVPEGLNAANSRFAVKWFRMIRCCTRIGFSGTPTGWVLSPKSTISSSGVPVTRQKFA